MILTCPTPPTASDAVASAAAGPAGVNDIKRRDLLRLVSATTAAISFAPLGQLSADPANRPLSAAGLAELTRINKRLWVDFATAANKTSLYPSVHRQLNRLIGALRRPQHGTIRRHLYAATADVFQLAGEVMFDANRYSDAVQCYTLAATAARETDAWDLWSCALTRHAYLSLYKQRPTDAVSLSNSPPMSPDAATRRCRPDTGPPPSSPKPSPASEITQAVSAPWNSPRR